MARWKCEEGLRQLVALIERGDANSEMFFHVDFLPVLDAFLSQLIVWAEAKSPSQVKDWSGTALAERLRFLSSQEQEWIGNEAFAATQKRFGDRRGARTPLSYLGWLAGDYVRVINRERGRAAIRLSPGLTGVGMSVSDLVGDSQEQKQWWRTLAALEEFSADSAPTWAQMVFERMLLDENKILSAPEMRGRQSRDAKRRTIDMDARPAIPWIRAGRSRTNNVGKALHSLALESERQEAPMRLSDYKETIVDAVIRLAKKPRGGVRGVTRP